MAPNPFDYFAIQNTISKYCIALDTKQFDLLHEVFTKDVDARYPVFSKIKDVDALADAIKKRLAPVTTQHALSTQLIEIAEDGKSAEAYSYFTGMHFGQGRWQGRQLTVWGAYVDRLTLVVSKKGLPGSSGQWLIEKREVLFMGRKGEEMVMDGE